MAQILIYVCIVEIVFSKQLINIVMITLLKFYGTLVRTLIEVNANLSSLYKWIQPWQFCTLFTCWSRCCVFSSGFCIFHSHNYNMYEMFFFLVFFIKYMYYSWISNYQFIISIKKSCYIYNLDFSYIQNLTYFSATNGLRGCNAHMDRNVGMRYTQLL